MSKPAATSKRSDEYRKAHELVEKGDPRHNGPYLDDIRAQQESEYRKARQDALKLAEKTARAEEKKAKSEEAVHTGEKVEKGK